MASSSMSTVTVSGFSFTHTQWTSSFTGTYHYKPSSTIREHAKYSPDAADSSQRHVDSQEDPSKIRKPWVCGDIWSAPGSGRLNNLQLGCVVAKLVGLLEERWSPISSHGLSVTAHGLHSGLILPSVHRRIDGVSANNNHGMQEFWRNHLGGRSMLIYYQPR